MSGRRGDAEGRPPRGPQRLGSALDRLLGTMRAPSVDVLDTVFSRWDEVVGSELAAHSRPSAIDGDRLVVTADDPTWASEFRWLEREVLDRLEEVTGERRFTEVAVRVRRRE